MQLRLTRLAVLVVGLSLTVAACGQYSISNLRAMKAFKEANDFYKKGEFKSAVDRYQRALQYNPDFLGSTYFFLGNSYDNLYKPAHKGEPENDGYLDKAVANYELAIQKIKDDEQDGPRIRRLSYEYLIAAYGSDKLDDFDRAEPVAQRLIALDTNDPTSYQTLGKLYEDAGRYDEAEAMYQKAIDVRPNDAFGYQILAGYLNRQGQFDKTMVALQAVANLEPNNPEAWHTMATRYEEEVQKDFRLSVARQKDYVQKGLEADDKALSLNPEYYEAMTYKNILLRMAAKYEKNPVQQKKMLDEADALYKKSIALREKQQTAAAKKGGGDN
jgi:tetratricopeptide (TPR) repeat protein